MNTKLVDEFIEVIPRERRYINGMPVYSDEVHIEMLSAMGSQMLEGMLPRVMIRDFIISYIKTDMWKYAYLFVDKEEIKNEFVMEILEG